MSGFEPPDASRILEADAKREDAVEHVADLTARGEFPEAWRELEALEEAARTPVVLRAGHDYTPTLTDVKRRLEAAGHDYTGTLADLRRRLEAADPAGAAGLRRLADFAGRTLPCRVLWMDLGKGGGTLLRVGDVAAIGGEGGAGKSYLSLALAVAAATAGKGPGGAVGLNVRKGGAVLISFEDDPETMAWRAGLIAARTGPHPAPLPDGLHLIPDPAPLMTADPDRPGQAREAPGWRRLFEGVAHLAPSLVIVDPVSAALAGVNPSDGGTVRRFVRALAREGAAGGWGTLLIAHSTKAGRFGATGPERLDAMRAQGGTLAGSGQWWDACRGVLAMARDGEGRALIQCQKANHGPTGWTVALEADRRARSGEADVFAGWLRTRRYGPEDWREEVARRNEWAKGGPAKPKGRTPPEADPGDPFGTIVPAPDGGPGL